MYSTFHGLELGKRGILSQQSALTTTGHNIANANTKGYTRQQAEIQATRALAYPSMNGGTQPMQMGTGVEITQLKRIRNQFLDTQFRNEQQKLGYYEAKAEALANVETVFNEPSDYGLDMALNRFWQSMQELSKNPDSLAARTIVLAEGQNVATNLNEISAGLTQNQQNLELQLNTKAVEINNSLLEVDTLNKQIALSVASGQQPNDLMDKRDLILDSLTKQIGVQVTPGENGKVELSLGGEQLLTNTEVKTFSIDPQAGGALVGEKVVSLENSEMKGLLDSHGYMENGTMKGDLPSLQSKVNELAKAIAEKLNAIHSSDTATNLEGKSEKLLFFVDKNNPTESAKDATSMTLNPLQLNKPEKIAAAKSTNSGDSSNAKEMADLQNTKISIGSKDATIGDYYHMILSEVAMGVQSAANLRDNADLRVQQIDTQRQSVSGVSIDEEMTNMVRYQQAYNAAAKYVSTVNEMLDKLINGMI
jgi:flagellar hook-associated protein 1